MVVVGSEGKMLFGEDPKWLVTVVRSREDFKGLMHN